MLLEQYSRSDLVQRDKLCERWNEFAREVFGAELELKRGFLIRGAWRNER